MIKPAAKSAYYSVLSLVRADARQMRRMLTDGRVAILNLHRISSEIDPYWSPMPPEMFDELARWLAANFHVSSLGEMAETRSVKPLAVLSFDDGYYDFVEYALPILEKYRLPANLNIIPDCAERGRPIWNVQLYDFLRAADKRSINELKLPGFDLKLSGESRGDKIKYGIAISRFLKNRPRQERLELWSKIETTVNIVNVSATRMMSTDEIRQILGRVEVGAHSYSHESMAFESDEFFLDDLGRCESYFSVKLGVRLTIYAFPNGSYRESQIDYLRCRGIEHILLVDESLAERASDVSPRLTIYGDSIAEIKMRALGY